MTPKVFLQFAKSFLSLKPSPGMIFNTLKYTNYFFLNGFKSTVTHDPLSIGLYITFKCNLDCPFCFNPAVNDKKMVREDMSVEEVTKILDHPRLKSAFRVSFVGGEPLIHQDIFKFIEICKKAKKLTMFPSNGLLIPKRIDEFRNCSLTTLQVSLYDGYMDQQLENLRLVKKVNPNINLAIARIVSAEKASYSSMEKFIKIAENLEIKDICFQNYQAKSIEDIHLSIFDDNDEVLDHFARLKSKYGNVFNIMIPSPLKKNVNERTCLDLHTVTFIGKGGVMAPCSNINPPHLKYGNIWDNDFWNNKYMVSHRENYNKLFPFHPACEYCYESSRHERAFI